MNAKAIFRSAWMRYGSTIEHWRMGTSENKPINCSADTNSLLQTPFDFSQAFDAALKNIVIALPNRPTKESSEDAVCPLSHNDLRASLRWNRCTIVPTRAALANMHVTLGRLVQLISIIWCPWKESLRSALLFARRS